MTFQMINVFMTSKSNRGHYFLLTFENFQQKKKENHFNYQHLIDRRSLESKTTTKERKKKRKFIAEQFSINVQDAVKQKFLFFYHSHSANTMNNRTELIVN